MNRTSILIAIACVSTAFVAPVAGASPCTDTIPAAPANPLNLALVSGGEAAACTFVDDSAAAPGSEGADARAARYAAAIQNNHGQPPSDPALIPAWAAAQTSNPGALPGTAITVAGRTVEDAGNMSEEVAIVAGLVLVEQGDLQNTLGNAVIGDSGIVVNFVINAPIAGGNSIATFAVLVRTEGVALAGTGYALARSTAIARYGTIAGDANDAYTLVTSTAATRVLSSGGAGCSLYANADTIAFGIPSNTCPVPDVPGGTIPANPVPTTSALSQTPTTLPDPACVASLPNTTPCGVTTPPPPTMGLEVLP